MSSYFPSGVLTSQPIECRAKAKLRPALPGPIILTVGGFTSLSIGELRLHWDCSNLLKNGALIHPTGSLRKLFLSFSGVEL